MGTAMLRNTPLPIFQKQSRLHSLMDRTGGFLILWFGFDPRCGYNKSNKSKTMANNKHYNLHVDPHNTKAAINAIQQRLEEEFKRDFEAGLMPDGSVPRGLVASLARKYGYTNAWAIKMLKRLGYTFERKVVVS